MDSRPQPGGSTLERGKISLRPATPRDSEFLCQVYASTRAEEMERVDWSNEQKSAFLRMQYEAQDRYYRENYTGADFQVVELDGKGAGRLYLHRRPAEIRVMEISLLPEARGRGFGQELLQAVLAEGQSTNRPVTIHVERFNPALRLYRRLGFQLAEDKGVYYLLQWNPAAPGA